MNLEQSRLNTFQTWPANAEVEPQRIAKAGFYYTGNGLEVECFSCGHRISEWNYGDQVMARHRQLNPDCPFVKDPITSGNIPVVYRSPSLYSQVSETNQNSLPSPSLTNRGEFLTSPRTSNASIGGEATQDVNNLVSGSARSSVANNSETSNSNANSVSNRSETVRLQSFATWPKSHIVSPLSLAKSGFFYLQEGDWVQCAFCSGKVHGWEEGDNPDTEHRRHFPSCPSHNVGVGSIPMNNTTVGHENVNQAQSANEAGDLEEVRPFSHPERDTSLQLEGEASHSELNGLGIHTHRGPKHPKYFSIDSRLRTFANWPQNVSQTPQQLAQAGFYYTGSNDQVRCFHCDGGLRQWDANDDPWVEHARWFSKCTYVLLVKGDQFIQNAIAEHPPLLPSQQLQRADQGNPSGSRQGQTESRVHVVSAEELERMMTSSPVRVALEVGLDPNRIRGALLRKVEQTGVPYTSSDALIEAVLDLPSDDASPSVSARENAHSTEGEQERASIPVSEDVHVRTHGLLNTSKSLPSIAGSQSEPTLQGPEVKTQSMPRLTREKSVKKLVESESSLEEENRRLKEARLCKICMDEEVGAVFVPCGHLATCVNCAASVQDCPMCRQPIKATVRTFLS